MSSAPPTDPTHEGPATLALPELNARRRQAVALRLEGRTLAEAAQVAGLSEPTVVAAHKAWRSGGWEAVDVRPRGRKPTGERHLSAEDEAALVAEWARPAPGVWTLQRAIAEVAGLHPALDNLAPTQLEPMVLRLWQRAGLSPANNWDAWRRVSEGPLAQWVSHELPDLRRLAREADAALLALSERRLTGQSVCQLAAHTGRGSAFWRMCAAWPTEGDWTAFWAALREEVGRPLWLVTNNRWLARRPALAAWLANPAHGVQLVHPPEQRPAIPEPPIFAPL